jgi:hypothetical protein
MLIFTTDAISADWPLGVIAVSNCLVDSHSTIICVDSDYYDWTYEQRMYLSRSNFSLALSAPSIVHLCKTVLFENTKWESSFADPLDRRNSKYYFVVVQYVDKIQSTKLNNFVRCDLGSSQASRKKYNLRVTSEDNALEITGFIKNGVCPIGSKQKIPVIITQNISKLDPQIVYLGAGHPDYKIKIPFQELVNLTSASIADLSY